MRGGNCSVGYEGILCTRCGRGFYRLSGDRCVACPAASSGLFALLYVLLATVSVVVVAVLMSTMRRRLARFAQARAGGSDAVAVRSPSMLLQFLQVRR